MVKVKKLEVTWFRNFRNETIPIGDKVTVIVGQNGTSKSTLLGMLAQPFGFNRKRSDSLYTANYHNIDLTELTPLNGRQFDFNCDQIFRLSERHDHNKDYNYNIYLCLPDDSNLVDGKLVVRASMTRRKKNSGKMRMRFVTSPSGTSHQSGQGNFPHPVIYLGLERLYPQAVSKTCHFTNEPLSEADEEWYLEQYQKVLCLTEPSNKSQFMETSEKSPYLTPVAERYDGESCSAGQDNISQILTAIRSFYRLKQQLKDKYMGGLLLIDELDATLHARAQTELLELLCKTSRELDLQVIATSHSLWLLEQAYRTWMKRDVKRLFLEKMDDRIVVADYQTYDEVMDRLKVSFTKKRAVKRIPVSVVVEDSATKNFLRHICGSKLSKYYKCVNLKSVGSGNLKGLGEMAKSIPEVSKLVLVADGDMLKNWPEPPSNLLCLPGEHLPERVIYEHLLELPDSDPFWRKCGTTYCKQTAITVHGGNREKLRDSKWIKRWYRGEKSHWGRLQKLAFDSWIKANKSACLAFAIKFIGLIKKHYKGGDIPESDIAKALRDLKPNR